MKTEVTIYTESGIVYTYVVDLPLVPEGQWVSSPKNPLGKVTATQIRVNDDYDVVQYVTVR